MELGTRVKLCSEAFAELAFISVLVTKYIYSLLWVSEELKKLPAPQTAIKYYTNEDLYLFGKSLDLDTDLIMVTCSLFSSQ